MSRYQRVLLLVVLLAAGALRAQPLLSQEELRALPLDSAMVLDPALGWSHAQMSSADTTPMAAIEIVEGGLRVVVAEPGKFQGTERQLAIPVDPRRYPVAVITYRAWGLAARDEGLVIVAGNGLRPILRNRDAILDGEVHDVVVDLAESDIHDDISYVRVSPWCEGPEPAVFDLLGLRFESDGGLPPADNGPAPEFAIQIIDRANQPVAGATVTVDAELLNASRSAVTDANGKATIQALATPGGRHMALVTKEGMAPAEIVPKEGEDLPSKVMLLRGTRYGGIVRNEEGEPVPGVAVRIGGSSADGTPQGRAWGAKMLTDETGHWLSPVLPDEESIYAPELQHPDYQDGDVKPDSLEALRQGKAELVIRRGVTLHGRVLSPDGQPVAEAAVRYRSSNGTPESTKTDANGEFSFSALRRGRLTVVAQHPAFAPTQAQLDLSESTTETTLRLEPPTRLWGRVVDPAGKPIPGVHLMVEQWRRSNALSWGVMTDRQGAFSWDQASADPILLLVEQHGYLTLRQCPIQASADGVTIVLPQEFRIVGTVTAAATRQPVPDCRVSLGTVPADWTTDSPAPPRWEREQADTDARGRFRISLAEAEPGREVVVKIEKGGYGPFLSRRFRLDGGEQTLDVALAAGGSIEGALLFPDGRPAGETAVYLAIPGQSVFAQSGPRVYHTNAESAQTEADGRFRFPAKLGRWRIAAFRAEGYAEADNQSFPATGHLILQPWATVEGTWRREGKPLPGCQVEIRTYPPWVDENEAQVQFMLKAVTDAQGCYAVPGVPPGLIGIQGAPPEGTDAWRAPSRQKMIRTVAGETTRVDFGGIGRPVTGRLALAAGVPGTVAWETKSGTIAPRFARLEDDPKLPKRWRALTPEEQTAWLASEEGKAFTAAQKRRSQLAIEGSVRTGLPHCQFRIAADGGFRVPDLPPGDYLLTAGFRLAPAGEPAAVGQTLVKITHEFTMPEVPGGWSAEPLDLGALLLEVRQ